MPGTRHAAIVTGSTSGIGRAIAMRLLGSGYSVILNYSSGDERASETLDRCREISPHVELAKADIRDSSAVAELTRRAVDAFGRIDVLVNNAARVIDKPALEMTEEEWDAVLDVNLKGAFLCSQYAARQMLEQDEGGVILNIGASTGIRGRRNGANTCASKAGLMMLTQCLALELAPKIRVNTIVPGLTVTDETEQRFGLHDPAVRRTREESIPMQRLGSPEDIADAVMLMLADESRFITGQKIVVDGGQYMWLIPCAGQGCLHRPHRTGKAKSRCLRRGLKLQDGRRKRRAERAALQSRRRCPGHPAAIGPYVPGRRGLHQSSRLG